MTHPSDGNLPDPHLGPPYPGAHPPAYPGGQPYPGAQPYPGTPPYHGFGAPAGYPAPPWGAQPPAPKPGIIPLRPLGLGEILDGAMSYIRANPKVTLGLAAIAAAIIHLVQLPTQLLTFSGFRPATEIGPALDTMIMQIRRGLIGNIASGVVAFVVGTVLTGMLIVIVSRAVVGQKSIFGEVWASVRPRLLGLFGLSLIILLAFAAVYVGAIPFILCLVFAAPVWISILVGLLTAVLLVIASAYLWVSLSLAAPVYILEGTSVTVALQRSYRLVHPNWWRIFGIKLLGAIITLLLGAILATPFSIGLLSSGFSAGLSGASSAPAISTFALCLTAIGGILATTVTAPFTSGINSMLYFDQRMRREGLDIELARTAAPGPMPGGAQYNANPAWPNPN